MTRFTSTLIAVIAIAALSAFATPATADSSPYPWCAVYGGMGGYDATNCGFSTLAQCRATISGIGGYCEPNQFYKPPAKAKTRRNRKQ